MGDPSIRKTPLVVLAVLTCVLGVGSGCMFGSMAAEAYGYDYDMSGVSRSENYEALLGLGRLFGSAGGLGAGLLWSALVIWHTVRGKMGLAGLFGAGTGWGVVVGALTGMFSHVGMALAAGRQHYLLGAIFGVGVGLFVGLVCAGPACAAAWYARPGYYAALARQRAEASGAGDA